MLEAKCDEGETGNARDYLTLELNPTDYGELFDEHLRESSVPFSCLPRHVCRNHIEKIIIIRFNNVCSYETMQHTIIAISLENEMT